MFIPSSIQLALTEQNKTRPAGHEAVMLNSKRFGIPRLQNKIFICKRPKLFFEIIEIIWFWGPEIDSLSC